MVRRRSLMIAAVTLALAAMASGCGGEPVGSVCFIDEDDEDGAPSGQSIISSPALECTSRTCLHTPLEGALPEGSEHNSLCTAPCESDSDCARASDSPCQEGFTCAVPVVVGPFCCRPMCVCKDYLEHVPDDGLPIPEACNPEDETNRCCNLPGREDDAHCQ